MVAARQRSLLVADLAVKSALIALLLFAVLRPDLPQFAGKAMTGRAVGYPAAALAVPVLWWLYGRSHGWRYPYLVDILLVSPFLVDMAGNALNLYDTITWWDDANHFANWGRGRIASSSVLSPWVLARSRRSCGSCWST